MYELDKSMCVECGKIIPAGLTQQCIYGGLCSHHIPRQLRDVINLLRGN